SSNVARTAPRNWATMYAGTRFHGKSPRAAKATLTAGLRCAPETVPMNKMMAATISAGATTRAPIRDRLAPEPGIDHAAAHGHQDEEKRAQQLREQSPSLITVV